MTSAAPRILAFSGSARRGSWNAKLLAVAIKGAEEAGANVTTIDLATFPLPLYQGHHDGPSPVPAEARKLRALVKEHDGLLIATPEYHGSLAPLVANALDWVAQADGALPAKAAYAGKAAALLSASRERVGGLKGLAALSSLLGHLGVLVQPPLFGVGAIDRAFGADGTLVDKVIETRVKGVGQALAKLLGGPP